MASSWTKAFAILIIGTMTGCPAGSPTGSVDARQSSFSKDQVTIYRDRSGVPHVYADNVTALFYGAGYALAQDRLAQFELGRRASRGRLAEALGPNLLEADKQARLRLESEDELQAQLDRWEPEYRQMLDAYLAGINAHIDEAIADPGQSLPYEFLFSQSLGAKLLRRFPVASVIKSLGLMPQHWTPTDYLAFLGYVMRTYGQAGGHELENLAFYREMVARHGEAKARQIFDDVVPLSDPDAVPIVAASSSQPVPQPGAAVGTPPLSAVTLDQYQTALAALAEGRSAAGFTAGASRSVVVGPGKSKTGHVMMLQATADGPDLHLAGAGFDVAGFVLQGMTPIMGRGPNFGILVTTGESDTVDIFAEKLNPQNKYQYQFQGAWRDMEVRSETIKVSGAEPVTIEVARTVHGPVVAWDVENGTAYSEKSTLAGRMLDVQASQIECARAGDLAAFERALTKQPSSSNVQYGGEDGTIATWHTGGQPIRAEGVDPRLPTPGTGEYEWKRLTSFSEWPHIKNPPAGYLHVWNNKPTADERYGDPSRYGKTFRTYLGRGLVEASNSISMDDMREINRKIGSSFGGSDLSSTSPSFFAPYLRQAVAGDARLTEVVERMLGWNAIYEDLDSDERYDNPGLTIYRKWIVTAQEDIVGDDIGEWWRKIDENKYIKYRTEVLYRAIEGSDAGAPMKYDWFNGKDRNEVLRSTVAKTAAALEEQYKSSDISTWKQPIYWKFYNPDAIAQNPDRPIFNGRGQRGTVAGRLGLQPAFVRHNGSEQWNALMEISPETKSFFDVTPTGGQNQFINLAGEGNPNIADQVKLHVEFKFKEVPMTPEQVKSSAVSRVVLDVPAPLRGKASASADAR